MSSDIIIRVEDVSKVYHIYDQPRDRLWQMIMRGRKQFYREFWALRNISFEIGRGETVGIVGHNGSGKSTLLQMIAGTLTPSSGSISVKGKVAALLELGSGFNPEFSGRENVMLYGQILGMTEEEISRKYDAIIDFSEIGDFIDQPLKTYSSGMYVRLAFSVAIHVEPEILIVDEALSVGDAFFQAKCMSVMKKLMESGTTLLFVSHDASAVKALCNRAILLDHGNLEAVGDTDDVIEAYYATYIRKRQATIATDANALTITGEGEHQEVMAGADAFNQRAGFQRLKNGQASFINVQVLDVDGKEAPQVNFSDEITLRMVLAVDENLPVLAIGYHIRDKNGFDVAYSDTGLENSHLQDLKAGQIYVIDWIFRIPLRAGGYSVTAVAAVPIDMTIGQVQTCDHIPIAAQFAVLRGHFLPLHGAVHLGGRLSTRLLNSTSKRAPL